MTEPRLKVTQGNYSRGQVEMSLNTGPEKHSELGELTGGAHLQMYGGSVTPYNELSNDELKAEPNGQLPLYDIKRPEIGSLYASRKGRAYVPQMLALARKHSIKETGVLPTHSEFLFPDSQRVVDKAVGKGWVAKNPNWDEYVENPITQKDSEDFGLRMASKYVNSHWGDSRNMELTSEQTNKAMGEGKSELKRLMNQSSKASYPIISRGPKPIPGQGRLI